MKQIHTFSRTRLCTAALLALACGAGQAADAPDTPPKRTVYQQRLPDGELVLTERPGSGGRTERSWSFTAEDPQAAAARRAEMRAESDAVSERVQRLIEHRERIAAEQSLEHMRLEHTRAWLESERAAGSRRSVTIQVPVSRRAPGS